VIAGRGRKRRGSPDGFTLVELGSTVAGTLSSKRDLALIPGGLDAIKADAAKP
jgi:hypothetical protein